MQSSQTIEMHTETFSEVKTSTSTVKKSRSLHRKKSRKDEKNISVKSSSEKVQKKIKHEGTSVKEANPNCQACGKAVYVMERVKAEKLSWHKECFRCKECNKLLTVENFESHLSSVYCKPHFKLLFAPKAVEEDEHEQKKIKKPQMIICESKPAELPPDVFRASDKPDLGLEELSSLDVKSKFQMFEKGPPEPEQKPLEHPLARDKSSTLLSKLAKFKSKGMDIGVSDDYLNGIPIEPSSSEEDEDDPDAALRKSYKQTAKREQPVSFCNMSEILGKFESGDANSKDRHDERKQEIQSIRSRLFMGKQAKIKEMYQQSVMQSEQSITSAEKIAKELQMDSECAASTLKQKFEKGEIRKDDEEQKKEFDDKAVFNAGISKKSRSIFQEMDANVKNSGPLSPPPPKVNEPRRKEMTFIPKDIVRADDRIEDVKIETSDISNKFKFFETYQPQEVRKEFRMTPPKETKKRESPEQELYRDPTIVREVDTNGVSDSTIAQQRHTASKMINVFKQMEVDQNKDQVQGPKPLKRFTPPPPGADYHAPSSSENDDYTDEEYSEYSDEEEEEAENVKKYTNEDEALKQAQALAKAKNLRNRFENWSQQESKVNQSASVIFEFTNMDGQDESQIESAKSLRNKFESMRNATNVVKTMSQTKVNRFV